MTRLYASNVFGWDTDTTAKVAIAQSQNELIPTFKCPKAELIRNESMRWQPNIVKILGYIPIINVVVGIAVISENLGNANSSESSPNHKTLWRGRAVAMIFCGPLLFVIDLIMHLHHLRFAKKYSDGHPELMQAFNTTHGHTEGGWPGHPIDCLEAQE